MTGRVHGANYSAVNVSTLAHNSILSLEARSAIADIQTSVTAHPSVNKHTTINTYTNTIPITRLYVLALQ